MLIGRFGFCTPCWMPSLRPERSIRSHSCGAKGVYLLRIAEEAKEGPLKLMVRGERRLMPLLVCFSESQAFRQDFYSTNKMEGLSRKCNFEQI